MLNDYDDGDDATTTSKTNGDMATSMTSQMEVVPTQSPMLSMKIIQLDRCQETNNGHHHHHHHYRGRSMVVEEEQVPVLSLRQKTSLFGILLIICQFATVDTYQLLPFGAILYAMGIGCALELIQEHPDAEIEFVLPWHERSPLQKKQEHQRRRRPQQEQPPQEKYPTDELLLKRIQDMVNFEYQVLQGFAKAPRVVAREEAGTVVYYTVWLNSNYIYMRQ